MTEALKECPFCGSGIVAHGLFANNHMFVRCMDCDTCGPYILVPEHTMEMHKYIAQAYASWNRRTPPIPACLPSEPDVAWLHKFINCVPFGADAPQSDIQRAHDIVEQQRALCSALISDAAHVRQANANYREENRLAVERAEALMRKAEMPCTDAREQEEGCFRAVRAERLQREAELATTTARALGRQEGLEEAARVADNSLSLTGGSYGGPSSCEYGCGDVIASAIRALKDAGGKT